MKLQYLAGHNIVAVLWFQYNLIFTTLLIVIIEFLFNKDAIFILLLIEIFSYFLQYSNYNFRYFYQFNYYKRYTFGRFFEIIPFCITGYILSSLNIITFLKKFRIKTMFFILLIIILISKYNILNNTNGFGYQSIKTHILSGNIFMIISLLPSENLKNYYLIKIIKLITSYTAGIYYLHIPIQKYLKNYIQSIKRQSLTGCVIIYITCYFFSFLGIKLFGKTKLRHLFL